jgi:hypothetical protein
MRISAQPEAVATRVAAARVILHSMHCTRRSAAADRDFHARVRSIPLFELKSGYCLVCGLDVNGTAMKAIHEFNAQRHDNNKYRIRRICYDQEFTRLRR